MFWKEVCLNEYKRNADWKMSQNSKCKNGWIAKKKEKQTVLRRKKAFSVNTFLRETLIFSVFCVSCVFVVAVLAVSSSTVVTCRSSSVTTSTGSTSSSPISVISRTEVAVCKNGFGLLFCFCCCCNVTEVEEGLVFKG